MENSEHSDRKEIRRPMNAFLIFCKRHRSMVREKNPHLDNRSVTRILGELWANLNDQEKTVYTDLAKQYKEAFMKANPDYKWHNPEKMWPVVIKTPTLLRGSKDAGEPISADSIVPGKLADPSNMGGLNLLLMAGEHSLNSKLQSGEQETLSSGDVTVARGHVNVNMGDNSSRLAEHELKSELGTQVNTALLELAEMCSTQLVESNKSTILNIPRSGQRPLSPVTSSDRCVTSPRVTSSLPSHIPSACQPSVPTVTTKSSTHCSACKSSTRSTNQLLYSLIAEKPNANILSKENNNESKKENTLSQRQSYDKMEDDSSDKVMSCDKVVVDHIIDQFFSRDALQDNSQRMQRSCDSDLNLIYERKMSQAQIEAVIKERLMAMNAPRSIEECMTKIITQAYSSQIRAEVHKEKKVIEEETSAVTPIRKNSSLMSQMLQTGSYEPPTKCNLEDSSNVIKTPCLKPREGSFVRPDPVAAGKSMEARMRLPKKRPYPGDIDCQNVNIRSGEEPLTTPTSCPSPGEPLSSPASYGGSCASKSPRYDYNQSNMTYESGFSSISQGPKPLTDVAAYDKAEASARATRKSKRRNRGQRYLELINEGIIQPSKERLAAIRTESLSSMDDSPSDEEWKLDFDEDTAVNVKWREDSDLTTVDTKSKETDHPRYKSGDFDLEAHIATLPPCSMDSLNKKKRRHVSGGSYNNSTCTGGKSPSRQPENKTNSKKSCSGFNEMEVTLSRPPHVKLVEDPGEVTGSRKRKARKHIITHLIAVQPDFKPPGVTSSGVGTLLPLCSESTLTNRHTEKLTSAGDNVRGGSSQVEPCHRVGIKEGGTSSSARIELSEVRGLTSLSEGRVFKTAEETKPPMLKTEYCKMDIYEFSEESEDADISPSLVKQSSPDKTLTASPRKPRKLFSKQTPGNFRSQSTNSLVTHTAGSMKVGMSNMSESDSQDRASVQQLRLDVLTNAHGPTTTTLTMAHVKPNQSMVHINLSDSTKASLSSPLLVTDTSVLSSQSPLQSHANMLSSPASDKNLHKLQPSYVAPVSSPVSMVSPPDPADPNCLNRSTDTVSHTTIQKACPLATVQS